MLAPTPSSRQRNTQHAKASSHRLVLVSENSYHQPPRPVLIFLTSSNLFDDSPKQSPRGLAWDAVSYAPVVEYKYTRSNAGTEIIDNRSTKEVQVLSITCMGGIHLIILERGTIQSPIESSHGSTDNQTPTSQDHRRRDGMKKVMCMKIRSAMQYIVDEYLPHC